MAKKEIKLLAKWRIDLCFIAFSNLGENHNFVAYHTNNLYWNNLFGGGGVHDDVNI
jgi:hypothetical protein